MRAWDSERRFVFVIAGTQSGKTSFGPWWLRREIGRCGPGDYLAVTSTYDLFKLKMLPEMQHVFTVLLASEGWEWQASDRIIYRARPETRIILRSAVAEGGIESATAKAAWLDECGQDDFRIEGWEAVQRRLSLSQGRVLGTTTPYNLGWLKHEVFDRWQAGDHDFEVVQFKSIENPRFPVAEYERMRDRMAAWKFAMFYDGNFSRPAGLIYSDFDDAENRCAPFDVPAHWPRIVGVDFGAVNTALVWLARDPDSQAVYIYRESLAGGMTTKDHCKRATEQIATDGVRGVRFVGGAKSETQQRMDWAAEGVPVQEPAIADVEAGIDRVTGLIKTRRLRVFDSCRGLLDEFGTYARELGADGQPTMKIRDKEKFHRLDALRYGASALLAGVGRIHF